MPLRADPAPSARPRRARVLEHPRLARRHGRRRWFRRPLVLGALRHRLAHHDERLARDRPHGWREPPDGPIRGGRERPARHGRHGPRRRRGSSGRVRREKLGQRGHGRLQRVDGLSHADDGGARRAHRAWPALAARRGGGAGVFHGLVALGGARARVRIGACHRRRDHARRGSAAYGCAALCWIRYLRALHGARLAGGGPAGLLPRQERTIGRGIRHRPTEIISAL
ncbi:hypothetical protein E8A74_01460 [Polyangium fumosum]|uniref:Uncharacterized protein n=1 Tax=Polyangium fumosum TaxID=889272 RepID=A0A4U1JKQ3_9BACT|nr:hypothetical protein E8A74_01460 [Polyangium fumosum]